MSETETRERERENKKDRRFKEALEIIIRFLKLFLRYANKCEIEKKKKMGDFLFYMLRRSETLKNK